MKLRSINTDERRFSTIPKPHYLLVESAYKTEHFSTKTGQLVLSSSVGIVVGIH